jgi:hypothetical protein
MKKDFYKMQKEVAQVVALQKQQAKLYSKTMEMCNKYKHRATEYTVCVLGYAIKDMQWEDYMSGIQLIHKTQGMLLHIRVTVYFDGGDVQLQLLGPIAPFLI